MTMSDKRDQVWQKVDLRFAEHFEVRIKKQHYEKPDKELFEGGIFGGFLKALSNGNSGQTVLSASFFLPF